MSLDSILRATGKNLFDKSTLTAGTNVVEFTQTANGFTFKTAATQKTMLVGSNIYLIAGTYYCSGTVTCSDTSYKGGWAVYDNETGKFIINASSRGTINDKFTITESKTYQLNFYAPYYAPVGVIMTFENVQLEKGSTATTYEPYEYLGPKSINLGSGSSSKEVLKVSYGSKNLIPYPYFSNTITNNEVTYTVNANGSIKISGTASADNNSVFLIRSNTLPLTLKQGEQHTLSGHIEGSGVIFIMQDSSFKQTISVTNTITSKSFTTLYSNYYMWLVVLKGTTVDTVVYPQLELGDKVTDYVPYFNTVVWEKQEIVATNKLGSFKLGESVLA